MRRDSGFTSVQFAVLATFAMLILAGVVNLVAVQYQLGAIRVAVDEGARHGAAALHTAQDCERLAVSILRDQESGLLRGDLGDDVTVGCDVIGAEMVATASGRSTWWIGGLPDSTFTVQGRAVLERQTESP